MYYLKNLSNTDLKRQITDLEYSDLWFYQKWKYTKMDILATDDEYVSITNKRQIGNKPPQSISRYGSPQVISNIHDDDYYNNNNSTGLLNTLVDVAIVDELLNQPPTIINEMNDYNQPVIDDSSQQNPSFEGFQGGDFGGGGSSASWQPDVTPSQNEVNDVPVDDTQNDSQNIDDNSSQQDSYQPDDSNNDNSYNDSSNDYSSSSDSSSSDSYSSNDN